MADLKGDPKHIGGCATPVAELYTEAAFELAQDDVHAVQEADLRAGVLPGSEARLPRPRRVSADDQAVRRRGDLMGVQDLKECPKCGCRHLEWRPVYGCFMCPTVGCSAHFPYDEIVLPRPPTEAEVQTAYEMCKGFAPPGWVDLENMPTAAVGDLLTLARVLMRELDPTPTTEGWMLAMGWETTYPDVWRLSAEPVELLYSLDKPDAERVLVCEQYERTAGGETEMVYLPCGNSRGQLLTLLRALKIPLPEPVEKP